MHTTVCVSLFKYFSNKSLSPDCLCQHFLSFFSFFSFFFFFTAELICFNHVRKCRCPQLHCHQVVKSSNLVLRMINTRLILPVEADRIISGLSLEPVCFSEQFFSFFFFKRDNSWRHWDQLEHTRGGFEVNSRRNRKPRWVGPLVGCDTWYEDGFKATRWHAPSAVFF